MRKSSESVFFLAWIYSTILTIANEEVNYIYFSEGETVLLKCMSGAHRAVWNGPAHTSSTPTPVIANDSFGKQKEWLISKYADDGEINTAIPNFRRLTVVRLDRKGDFDLEIVNASSSDEGLYKCDIDPVEGIFSSKLYIIQLKALPSNLTIENETDKDTIIGIEHQTLKLTCNVKSGIPPETIIWKRNGSSLKIGGPKRNVYELQLDRTDHNSNFTCEVTNNLTKIPLTKTVQLDIQYKPHVLISHEQTISVVEGSTKKLCCEIDSNPNISFMYWSKNHKSHISNTNSMCLILKQLTRQDNGNYTCLAGNEIGNGSFTASLVVFYPPTVYLKNKNFSVNESERNIYCKGHGVPNNLTFFRVEHKSFFNESIRYLKVTPDGIANLPPTNESHRYQDSGLYLCNASNGVPDGKGSRFQQGEAYLVSDGPPVFVADNKKIQYGQIGKPMEIKVKVYSTSDIKCHHLSPIGGNFSIQKGISKKTVFMTINFHDVNITTSGIEVTFRLMKLSKFQRYDVTVCNDYSKTNFIVEVRKKVSGQPSKMGNDSTLTIAGCIVFGFIVMLVLTITILKKRQHNRSISIEEESDIVEGISQPVENIMYHSVQQGQPDIEHPSPVSTLLPDVGSENADTMSSTNMGDFDQSMENRLNYADVVFQPTSEDEIRIIGFEDRTVYADVDTSVPAASLPERGSETSSSEDDFVYVDGIENFIEKRETND